MTATRTFAKHQGLGNDFLLIDARSTPFALSTEQVRAICARRSGVGADGVLELREPAGEAAVAMVVHNSDGSVAEICGNGIRCVVWHLLRAGEIERGSEVVVETGAGPVRATAFDQGVEVAMGAPRVDASAVGMEGSVASPATDGNPLLPVSLSLRDRDLEAVVVSLGNPHLVIFDVPREHAAVIGDEIATHPKFPEGINAGFAHLAADGGIDLTVWERGAGLTLACGTGACAAMVAAVGTRQRPADRWVEVRLPGGTLEVKVDAGFEQVWLRGPAAHVFDGQLDPSAFETSRETQA